MYLKHIAIKNIGPISELSIKLAFDENENPKPLILVGENGAGKTIFQAQIIDSFYEIASQLFDDVGINNGLKKSYYKVSGGINLKIGTDKGFSALRFVDLENNSIEYFDKIGNINTNDIKDVVADFSLSTDEKNGNQKLTTNISDDVRKEKLEQEWIKEVHIFQPAYRYEEPFWKNDIFKETLRFEDKTRYSERLNKEIEIISSTKENKSYLMDLVLDFANNPENIIDKITWRNINNILRKIKKRDDIRFGIGPRGRYRVSIVEQNTDGSMKNQLLTSIDNLSLGESILLNLFINIVRHGDNPPRLTTEIKGIVAIDEIDVHLHTDLQNTVLPQLIKLFPKVQFIITTHSPLFILGMKREFGDDNFEIRNMPNGEVITTERFSEFENAYSILKNTTQFEEDINKKIKESQKPIVFVEGDYDIRYIKKASELFEKQELVAQITFIDADGYQNLNNIWNHKSNLFNAIPQNMLLLYDCDTKVENKEKNKIYKRIIPFIETNYFDRGIENLFSKDTITKAIDYKKAFIDYTAETKQTKRGEEKIIPEKYDVNPDEKGNLCNWICENGTSEDFKHFDKVFEILEDFLGKPQ
ncbi:MAG: AAA family ATPase [Sulfurimonas sp.]|nr:AAA family ATPase [Sulfurimonas sp.]